MSKIKKGDVVGRISYGKDIVFKVSNIIKARDNEEIAILKGITIRIEADAPMADLEAVKKQEIDNNMRILEDKLEEKIKQSDISTYKKLFFLPKVINIENKKLMKQNGKILHLDGDISFIYTLQTSLNTRF